MSRPLRNQWHEPQSKLKGNQFADLSGIAESEDGSGREGGLNISVASVSYLQGEDIILKKNINRC